MRDGYVGTATCCRSSGGGRSRCLGCVQRREDSGLLHTTCIPLNILIGTGMLLMANDEHVTMLKQGVDAWNEWRLKNPDIRPDLFGANFIGAYLGGTNLSWADLVGANLTGAYLGEANLSGACLSGANLSWADLVRANLTGAYLGGANLSGTYLVGANLTGANLSGAYLERAALVDADLAGA